MVILIMNLEDRHIRDLTKPERIAFKLAAVFALVGIVIFVGSFVLFSYHQRYDSSAPIDDSKFSNLGSLVGGVAGALWSFVGVILFYLSLQSQRKELRLQREELELTRKELSGQREQMTHQTFTGARQRFENTFFQFLNTHNSMVGAMELKSYNTLFEYHGKNCFKEFVHRLRVAVFAKKLLDPHRPSISEMINSYNVFFEENENDLGHYFRNLYHIMKFIDETEIIDRKDVYSDFIRGQLSNFELVVLFYNCLTPFGFEKFKPLIEKYALLKNLNKKLLFSDDHIHAYANSAFG